MPEYNINGVPVRFPFEIYDIQRRYMKKVIKTLKEENRIAVLESPTGSLKVKKNCLKFKHISGGDFLFFF